MQKHKEVLPVYIDDVGQHQVTRQWVAVYDGLYLCGYYVYVRNYLKEKMLNPPPYANLSLIRLVCANILHSNSSDTITFSSTKIAIYFEIIAIRRLFS